MPEAASLPLPLPAAAAAAASSPASPVLRARRRRRGWRRPRGLLGWSALVAFFFVMNWWMFSRLQDPAARPHFRLRRHHPLRAVAAVNSSLSTLVAGYWGQNSGEGSLVETCASGLYNFVNIAFLNKFGNGQDPDFNLTSHCEHAAGTCAALSSEISSCKDSGVTVLLSLGGAVGSYSLASADEACSLRRLPLGQLPRRQLGVPPARRSKAWASARAGGKLPPPLSASDSAAVTSLIVGSGNVLSW